MERVSSRYISLCQDIVSNENLASAYGDICISLLERGRYKETLKAAESGLQIKYDMPELHFFKARAYMGLGDEANANESLIRAEKIAHIRIQKAKDKLDRYTQNAYSDSRSKADAEVLKSEIFKYESLLGAISRVK